MEFKNQFNKFLLFGILGTGVLIKYFLHPEHGLSMVYISLFVFLVSSIYFMRFFVEYYKFSGFEPDLELRMSTGLYSIFINIIICFRYSIYLILKPSKLVTGILAELNFIPKFDELLVYLIATFSVSSLILIFSIIIAITKYAEIFNILDYFKKSDLIYSILMNNLNAPNLTFVVIVLAIVLVYFSLIEHIKSNKLYFKDLKDTKLKSYLDLIFNVYDLFWYIYYILGLYLLSNMYYLEFSILFLTSTISKGVFSTSFSKYGEYSSDYNKLDSQNSSKNMYLSGKRYVVDLSQKFEEKGIEFSEILYSNPIFMKEWIKENLTEKKVLNDVARIKMSKKPKYKITEYIYNEYYEFKQTLPEFPYKNISKNSILNLIIRYLLNNSSNLSNIFILMPILVFSMGIYLKFNLISITYLIICSIYCFTVLCVLSSGIPKKETIFLKNNDIIENGYILEDNPEKIIS